MAEEKKTGLFLIVALALLVRLPGLFWGFNYFTIPSFTAYHTDELHLSSIAQNILGEMDEMKAQEKLPKYDCTQKLICAGLALARHYARQEKFPSPVVHSLNAALFIAERIHPAAAVRKSDYPMGYPYQVAGMAALLHCKDDVHLVVIGRALSIFYALMTVILIFFFARELFANVHLALLACLFLALAGLHVTQSHYATVDAGNTFWMYATFYFSLLSIRRRKTVYFILALLSGGIGLTFKFAWVTLIPLFYILRRQKRAALSRLLTGLSLAFFFLLAVGSFNTLYNFIFILQNLFKNNIVVSGNHNKLLNPFIYFLQLFTGVGLPVFLLFLYGSWRLVRQRRLFENIFNKDLFVILFLPLFLHLVSICFIALHFCRHPLPVVPLIATVAAFGFMEVRGLKASFLFVFILIYQLVYVGCTEYYFVYDTREAAAKWIIENIQPGTALIYEGKPALYEYNVNTEEKSPYIVLTSKKYPKTENAGFGNKNPREIVEDLFNGNSNYTVIKKFEVKSLTPELFLYKKMLGSYPLYIGDTVIFKSNETASKNI